MCLRTRSSLPPVLLECGFLPQRIPGGSARFLPASVWALRGHHVGGGPFADLNGDEGGGHGHHRKDDGDGRFRRASRRRVGARAKPPNSQTAGSAEWQPPTRRYH